MNKLTTITNEEKRTYSSIELCDNINYVREQEGHKVVLRHSDLLRKIRVEFDDEIGNGDISLADYLDKQGKVRSMYELTYEQSLQILMSELKPVRKGVVKILKAQQQKINHLEQSLPSYQLEDPVARAKKWIEEQQQSQVLLEAKQQLIDEAQPKVDNYDRFISSDGYMDFADVAKILNIKGLGRNTLIEFLRNEKILNKKNKPYQAFVDRNYFKQISGTYISGFKTICYTKTVATPRGLEYIKKMIRKVYGDIV